MSSIEQSLATLAEDVAMVHDWAHGDALKMVLTEGGDVRSPARLIADKDAEINQAADGVLAAANLAADQANSFSLTAESAAEASISARDLSNEHRISAEAARDAALLSRGVFSSTAAALSKGVVAVAALVVGSGGTNGTFDLSFSGGGGSGAAGRFVVAGGAVVSVIITASGDSYTSAPVISFAASSGLTGATATVVIADNVAVGEYFSVPSANNGEHLVLYLNSAGSAIAKKTYPSSTQVIANTSDITNLKQAFDIVPPKNLYDPSLAEDGFLYNYVTGAKAAFANSILTGRIPVIDGNTYTLSQQYPEKGFLPHVYCWDAAGNYLGMDALITTNPVVSGMGLTASDPGGTGGYRKLTFTVPSGSNVAYVGTLMLYNYAAHTTTDFNRIRNATMIELGSSATAFEVYTTISSVMAREDHLPATIQRSAQVAPVVDAFDVVVSRNLYNKANAVDGQLISYATGLNSAYAPGIAFGYFPVMAGKTYTVSMGDPLGFTAVLYCRAANGSFLGIDHTVGATPGMSNPPTSIIWTGTGKVTFTIPAGSSIAFVGLMAQYSTHTIDDFNRIIGTVQAEEGSAATDYQRYAPFGLAVPKDSITEAVVGEAFLPTSVQRVGNNIYIRTAFDSSNDLVQKITLTTGAAFTNDTVNHMGARKAVNTVSTPVMAWSTGTDLQSSGDDSAPLNYNGTYIGANHGAFIVREVTATGHGKAVQDVGSEWIDGGGVKWYLMRIVDANKLWFVSQNNSVYPAWSFVNSITGSTLTHSSGATNTGAITVASSVQTQLWPCLKNQVKKVLLDGQTEVTADGIYRCTTLDIINSYEVTNPASVVNYVRSQVGAGSQPSFLDASIATDVVRTLTYQYADNGSCALVDGDEFINSVSLGYMGVTQAHPLTATGKQLWQYIPRVTPKVGIIKTWDFAAQEDISGTFEQLVLGSSNWTNANNPPDRMAQIVKSAGAAEFGLMVGYSPIRSIGLPAVRKTLVTEACLLSAIKKQYPKAINGGTLPAGSYYEMCAFRAYWPASANPDATCLTWYRDGKNIVVVVDFHKNVTRSKLPLPARFIGMDVAVVDKTDSLTLHGNGVVSAGGLMVSVTGGYGYGIFRIF